jgi:hypothetical protein
MGKGQSALTLNAAEFVQSHRLASRAGATDESAELGHRIQAETILFQMDCRLIL